MTKIDKNDKGANFRVTKLDTINELPTTRVLEDKLTLAEAIEQKKLWEAIYRGEIISIEVRE